jgi:GT2 family glycosyltransferase
MFFLDHDVVLEPEYIEQHMIRHELGENFVIFGLKKDVYIDDFEISDEKINARNVHVMIGSWTDFRYRKEFSVFDQQLNESKETIHFLEQTNHLKELSYGKVITPLLNQNEGKYFPTYEELKQKTSLSIEEYFHKKFENRKAKEKWGLPIAVVGHNISVSRRNALRANGFEESIMCCGDTHFGAKLIANGCQVIPCYATSIFSIVHAPREGNYAEKYRTTTENWARCQKLFDSEMKLISPQKFVEKYLFDETATAPRQNNPI